VLPGLMKKKMRANTLAAVYPSPEGIAVASVRRDRDMPPTLEHCAYQSLESARRERDVLENLVDTARLGRSRCVSLLGLGDYSLVMVEAPDVQPDEMRAAVRWRIKDLIDFNVDDAVIDTFAVPDTRSGGRNAMVYAVVAPLERVRKHIDRLLEAGLHLDVVDIPELALRNLAALLPEDVGGVALVHIGQEKGVITITRQQTLYLSRRLASGVNALPDTLMQSNDPDAIEKWLDGIIVEIQRSLDYYESHFALPPVGGLVVTPLSREVPGVAQYMSDQLDMSTRILDLHTLIDSEAELDSELQARCLLSIGAALRDEEAGR